MLFLGGWFWIVFNQAIYGVGGVETLTNTSLGNSTYALPSSVWSSFTYLKQIWAYLLLVIVFFVMFWAFNYAQKKEPGEVY